MGKETRDSFLFYRSYFEAIENLPENEQVILYKAIMNYALNNEQPTNLNGLNKSLFTLIKPNLDSSNKQYINGCKGGRPKTQTKPKRNPNETQTKANDNPIYPSPSLIPNPNLNNSLNEKDCKEKEIFLINSENNLADDTPTADELDVEEIERCLKFNFLKRGEEIPPSAYPFIYGWVGKFGKEKVIKIIEEASLNTQEKGKFKWLNGWFKNLEADARLKTENKKIEEAEQKSNDPKILEEFEW